MSPTASGCVGDFAVAHHRQSSLPGRSRSWSGRWRNAMYAQLVQAASSAVLHTKSAAHRSSPNRVAAIAGGKQLSRSRSGITGHMVSMESPRTRCSSWGTSANSGANLGRGLPPLSFRRHSCRAAWLGGHAVAPGQAAAGSGGFLPRRWSFWRMGATPNTFGRGRRGLLGSL